MAFAGGRDEHVWSLCSIEPGVRQRESSEIVGLQKLTDFSRERERGREKRWWLGTWPGLAAERERERERGISGARRELGAGSLCSKGREKRWWLGAWLGLVAERERGGERNGLCEPAASCELLELEEKLAEVGRKTGSGEPEPRALLCSVSPMGAPLGGRIRSQLQELYRELGAWPSGARRELGAGSLGSRGREMSMPESRGPRQEGVEPGGRGQQQLSRGTRVQGSQGRRSSGSGSRGRRPGGPQGSSLVL